MNETYIVTDYEVTCDQSQHPELNYPQFVNYADGELRKFVQMLAGLNSDFICPQDVSGVGGITCKFFPINGYLAVRQMSQYNPNSKSWYYWFDCRVLARAPEAIQPDGDMSAKLEPMDPVPGDEPVEAPAEVAAPVVH